MVKVKVKVKVNFACFMLKQWQHFIIIMGLILFTGCSTVAEKQVNSKQVYQLMPLLPVPESLQNRLWLEKFTFSLTGENSLLRNEISQQDMLLQTELTENGINIAAMSLSGIMLAQAQWQKDKQQVDSELGLAKKFDTKKVLHDLQLVNWPLDMLRPALKAGFMVEEQKIEDQINSDVNGSSKTRHFYHHGQEIIIVHYQKTDQGLAVSFEQIAQGYRLIITRLTDEIIPNPIN